MVVFGAQVCGDLAVGGGREWLVPDGLGGYAMGTVSGLRTRRYHGLLMVADPGAPARRHLGLVALDPVLTLPSGAQLALGVHEWADGAISPDGHRFLERFELVDGLPRWRWRIGTVVVERELAMVHGSAHLGVVHRLVAAPEPVMLTLKALLTWRDGHGERGAGGRPPVVVSCADGAVVERAYRIAGPNWHRQGVWYRAAYAREEAARGLTAVEDLWHAGDFTAELTAGDVLEVEAWAGDVGSAQRLGATRIVAAARQRDRVLVRGAHDEVDAALVRAADAFVVTGPGAASGSRVPDVIAGYPWFGTWSRDTMTSYEGLFLATGRVDEGRELLRAYAATLSEGMLANTADTGRTEYNTVDATLWFLHAVERHVASTFDHDLAAELAPALDAVVAAHVAGTRFGIRVDPADGLLGQGAPGVALTWMDARVDGVPVTPRAGKPVEVNALWINGLGGIADLLHRVGRDRSAVDRLRKRALESFLARFPLPDGAGLRDVVDAPGWARGAGAGDEALRPNQLLAYSLPRGPLHGSPLPAAVGAALLTPLGPRSLAPAEPGYLGEHRGDPAERDRAYHQGTVWPWLIGPYVDAAAAAGRSRRGDVLGGVAPHGGDLLGGIAPHGGDLLGGIAPHRGDLLGGIEAHLGEWGLGSVSETADGAAPHRATGCPFQAWSVAEVLRAHRRLGAGPAPEPYEPERHDTALESIDGDRYK